MVICKSNNLFEDKHYIFRYIYDKGTKENQTICDSSDSTKKHYTVANNGLSIQLLSEQNFLLEYQGMH